MASSAFFMMAESSPSMPNPADIETGNEPITKHPSEESVILASSDSKLLKEPRSTVSDNHLAYLFYEAANTWNVPAFKELQAHAEAGHLLAKGFLMRMWAFGSGLIPKVDTARATELSKDVYPFLETSLTTCSDDEKKYVEYLLSSCYVKGLGVAKDDKKAFEYAHRSAIRNYSPAQNFVGYCYEKGVGVDVNVAEGLRYYTLSAEQNHTAAQFNLGLYYKNATGEAKDEAKAFEWFMRSAVQNNIDSMYFVGIFYQEGLGIPQSEADAIKWFLKSAEQGCVWSMNSLGRCYKLGLGAAINVEEGARWYQIAADAGYAVSQHNLAFCYKTGEGVQQSDLTALQWFEKSAEQGDRDAQYQAGLYHFQGLHIPSTLLSTEPQQVIPVNIPRALTFFKQSHQAGLPAAMYYYGVCLMHQSIPAAERDVKAGLQLIENSAELSQPPALYFLGEIYYYGSNLNYVSSTQSSIDSYVFYKKYEKNYEKCVEYLKKCITQAHSNTQVTYQSRLAFANAYSLLGICYFHGYGVKKEAAEALKLFLLASSLRLRLKKEQDAYLLYNIGVCLFKGEGGVNKDAIEAVKHFRRSVEVEESQTTGSVAPNYAAYYALGWCYRYGEGIPKSREEAFKYFLTAAKQGNHAGAQYQVGLAYIKGKGVERDEEKGCKFLRLAAAQGHQEAKAELKIFTS